MKNLFIFLLIALICTYSLKPESILKIWISAILIPLISLVAYAVIISLLISPPIAGRETSMSFIPSIISGFVIYYQLKRKYENNNIVKFPIVLVIVIVISLVGSVYQHNLKIKTRTLLQEYYENNNPYR